MITVIIGKGTIQINRKKGHLGSLNSIRISLVESGSITIFTKPPIKTIQRLINKEEHL